jgi:PAS domain S-box-containing protein
MMAYINVRPYFPNIQRFALPPGNMSDTQLPVDPEFDQEALGMRITKNIDGLIKRHWIVRYGLAILVFGLLIAFAQELSHLIPRINQTVPVVFALVGTAWYLGRGPGILFSVLLEAITIWFAVIPADSTVSKAWFGYLSVFALYVFLVSIMSGLRVSQQRLTEQRDLLQTTLTSIGDGVIATDGIGNISFLNPVAEQLTGWNGTDAIGRPLNEIFRVVNEETRLAVPDPVSKVLATGTIVGLANHSVLLSKNGNEFPIDDSAAPIKDKGRIKGVVLVFSDVSQRKQAESARRDSDIMHRIVEAQESERHRIARDLHDHLGQRMTALRLKIESLKGDCTEHPKLGLAIADAGRAALQIDRDIGFLSWELRPTELEDLGLENALRSYVREWSGQYGITADFHTNLSDENADARQPKSLETNLYRILQEGLNNIAKHADAQNVSVLLQERNDQLVLSIEDDGRGFDAEGLSPDHDGPGGLGLMSMRERAALLKGILEVESSDGAGTTVLVRIPLAARAVGLNAPAPASTNNT